MLHLAVVRMNSLESLPLDFLSMFQFSFYNVNCIFLIGPTLLLIYHTHRYTTFFCCRNFELNYLRGVEVRGGRPAQQSPVQPLFRILCPCHWVPYTLQQLQTSRREHPKQLESFRKWIRATFQPVDVERCLHL